MYINYSNSLFKKLLIQVVFLLLCIAYVLLHTSTVHAGNMYWLEDKNGNTLLTNKKPKGKNHRYKKQIKVTWYKDTNVHQYKDWGKTEYAIPTKYRKNRDRFDRLIASAANRHGIDPALMKAIMHTESGFNPRARSPVGARGLMQLMPPTARQYGVRNSWDPAQNIEGSAKYLKYLQKLFRGDKKLILAGYNAGQGNVLKYKGIPPFKETRNYVKKVLSRYHRLYKNKNFVPTSYNSRSKRSSPVKVVRSRPIQRYKKNNTSYLKNNKDYTNSAFKALQNGRK